MRISSTSEAAPIFCMMRPRWDLDGLLDRAQIRRDVFVELAGDHVLEDLALAQGEHRELALHLAAFGAGCGASARRGRSRPGPAASS